VKLLADMGISPTTVAFLHALGHDAMHLADQGLERLPDPGIVEKARQEERILPLSYRGRMRHVINSFCHQSGLAKAPIE
jgi:Domain of unknown function (DUF5615)